MIESKEDDAMDPAHEQELPDSVKEAAKASKEPPKEYTIGEIRITENGVWACQWVGTQNGSEGIKFQEGYDSCESLHQLLDRVHRSINPNREKYLEAVSKHLEEGKDLTESIKDE